MKSLLIFCTVGFFLLGCVPPAAIKLGDQALLNNDYISAAQYYQESLDSQMDSSTRKKVEEKLIETKELLAEKYLEKAQSAFSREGNDIITALNHAIGILETVVQWDDARNSIKKQIGIYSRDKNKHAKDLSLSKDKALKFISIYSFNDALNEINTALAKDPANQELVDLKSEISKLIQRSDLLNDRINQGNLQGAIDAFNQLTALTSVELAFDDLPKKNEIVELIRRQSKELQYEGKWWQAYKFLTRWEIPDLQQSINQVRENGSVYYHSQALIAKQAGAFHKGYLLINRALTLNDRNLEIFNLNREMGDLVNNSIQSNIAIASFDSPSNDLDAGKQFSDSLISYLYQVLPYGINILERDKIDFVLKEKSDSEKQLAQILGVDLMVTGTVSLFRVDQVIDERAATVKVKSGEHILPNPEYRQFIDIYGTDKAFWPQAPPLRTIIQDIFQLVKYQKGHAEMKGFAKVSVRIFDTHKGAIAFVKDYDANVNYTSDFQDELAEAQIEYIPMKLPTDTEAKEEMRKQIVLQIGKIVQSSFENRETRFLNLANFYLERRQNSLAFKPLAEGYLYCEKEGFKSSHPEFVQIRRLVDDILN